MLDLLNYRLDEKGGAAEAPIEEDSVPRPDSDQPAL